MNICALNNRFNNSIILDDNKNSLGVGFITAMLLGSASATGFAAGSDGGDMKSIFKKFIDQFAVLRKELVIVSTGLAALLAVVCGIMIMVSKDEKKVGAAKEWLKRILVIFVFILAVTSIISLVGNFGQGLQENGDKMGDQWRGK